MEHKWKDSLVWALIACTGVLLALATPTGQAILGHVPQLIGVDLNRKPLSIPADLRAERTLVLVSFRRSHAHDVDTWVQGMNLHEGSPVAWVRMPVVNDPGSLSGRAALEDRLQSRYPSAQERARVVPVLTDQQAFLKSVGLTSTDQMSALVLNRAGQVLARVEGPFDAQKKALVEGALKQPL